MSFCWPATRTMDFTPVILVVFGGGLVVGIVATLAWAWWLNSRTR